MNLGTLRAASSITALACALAAMASEPLTDLTPAPQPLRIITQRSVNQLSTTSAPIPGLSQAARAASTDQIGVLAIDAAAYEALRDWTQVNMIVPIGNGATLTLDLRKFDVFTSDAQVIEMTETGPRALPRPDLQLWQGTVVGQPESRAYIGMSAIGAQGFITTDDGTGEGNQYIISTVPANSASDLAGRVVVSDSRLIEHRNGSFVCGGAVEVPGEPMLPTSTASRVDRDGNCRVIRVAIDGDQEFTSALFAGNSANSTAYVATLLGAVSTIYQRDNLTTIQTPFVRVWTTTDPYTSANTSAQLPQFASYWSANRPSVPHDLAHLLSGRALGGGIAYLTTLCSTGSGYGVSANLDGFFPLPIVDNNGNNWDLMVVAHELGHNFSSGHTHDGYTPIIDGCGNGDCTVGNAFNGTIMSYCHQCSCGMACMKMIFGPRPSAKIQAYVYTGAAAGCGINVAGTPPVINSFTSTGPTCPGGSVGFTINATGAGLMYKWYRGTTPLLPTGSSITLVNNQLSSNGLLVRCDVSNGCTTLSSSSIAISVCAADYNCMAGVGVQDIFDFLADWFGNVAKADINGVNGIGVQDIFDFMARWFAGC